MKFANLHPADQLIELMNRIYRYGMTTTSGGNLSIKDDEGAIWITPAGVDKGTLTRRDIVCMKADGSIAGIHRPSSEFPFHRQIYEARPDLSAVIHAHPPALVAFSVARLKPDLRLLPNDRRICGEIGMAAYALPGSVKLGENIADVFRTGVRTVMMENHGVVVGGTDLADAFMAFETLEFCARLEIKARQIGKPAVLPGDGATGWPLQAPPVFAPTRRSPEEREARREMCELIRRAYDQQLFTSTQGTFSRKLSDGAFLITPHDKDRKYLEPDDLVRMEAGRAEEGLTPSRSHSLHAAIYATQPHVGSVILAHPPNIMAFAVTDAPFDSRTIPESYILLRGMPKIPFGDIYRAPQEAAALFRPDTPIVIAGNDCVMVTGSSLLNAFDRLEVAEYSAKAIIAVRALGEITPIGESEIQDIEEAFHL